MILHEEPILYGRHVQLKEDEESGMLHSENLHYDWHSADGWRQ